MIDADKLAAWKADLARDPEDDFRWGSETVRALIAEVERMRPVFEAAQAWRATIRPPAPTSYDDRMKGRHAAVAMLIAVADAAARARPTEPAMPAVAPGEDD